MIAFLDLIRSIKSLRERPGNQPDDTGNLHQRAREPGNNRAFRFGIQFSMRGAGHADHIPEVLDQGVLEPAACPQKGDSFSAGQRDRGNSAFCIGVRRRGHTPDSLVAAQRRLLLITGQFRGVNPDRLDLHAQSFGGQFQRRRNGRVRCHGGAEVADQRNSDI